jgi:ribose 5-phosphate isomerase B
VADGKADRGILLCCTGVGMAIAANKVPGVRAATCHDEVAAEMSRRHNDLNVLCLAAEMVGAEQQEKMTEIWLNTGFEGGRHERRLHKITELEAAACTERSS